MHNLLFAIYIYIYQILKYNIYHTSYEVIYTARTHKLKKI